MAVVYFNPFNVSGRGVLVSGLGDWDSVPYCILCRTGSGMNEPPDAMGVDTRDEEGFTPLMLAVWNGYTTSATVLIDRGVDMEAKRGGASPG